MTSSHKASLSSHGNIYHKGGLFPPSFMLDRNTGRISRTSASWISGAIAGLVAESLLHPLDTISLRQKVNTSPTSFVSSFRQIIRTEGLRGLFGGFGTTLMASPVTTAMYFGTYDTTKRFLKSSESLPDSLVYLLAGAASELACSAVSVPSEVIKCRLQLGRNPSVVNADFSNRNYKHTLDAACRIIRSEGIKGLFAGFSACIAVDVSFSALSFVFYENLKAARCDDNNNIDTLECLAIGSVAGGFAAVLTNPLDVITVRMMTESMASKKKRRTGSGFADAVRRVIGGSGGGISALGAGTFSRVMNVVPVTGISFAIYESIKRVLFHGDLNDYDTL